MIKKIVFCFLIFNLSNLQATPTSLFWTNCITDVLETGDGHVDVDNNFTVFNRRGAGQFLDPDLGLLIGIFKWHNLSAEAGFDYLGGANDPLFFNGKIGMEEDQLFYKAPSFSIGMFNIGTETKKANRTHQNVFDLILGHSFDHFLIDHLYLGVYAGNQGLGKVRQGFMVGAIKSFSQDKDCHGREFHRWKIAGDWASGHNFLGGGGIAIMHYFTPEIFIKTGPIWFNTNRYNGRWKWSFQIDISFSLFESDQVLTHKSTN